MLIDPKLLLLLDRLTGKEANRHMDRLVHSRKSGS